MIDIGLSKMALIGAVALVVIGPEKLPRVARTVGTLLGKAQRYVADVKAEVNRSMELDELRKMKDSVESAARGMEQSVHTAASDFEKDWNQATGEVTSALDDGGSALSSYEGSGSYSSVTPSYRHPRKNWRIKRAAVPQWYKARAGVRSKAQSGAARVARFRPQKPR
ncbi:Sec-independent protein translocase protein TatB [Comamonas composti]|uniref:Sec-independent protein translocase protein TatB n=1 Tax=Comamonas composti TaxID=408558 RepID=UPI00041770F7|nr:Sec-independent protein translocase protein TatB [Comamonas composti]